MGAHLDRAWHFFGQSRYDLAEREARLELAAAPDSANAHALLGMCLTERKEHDEALREAEEAIRLRPDTAYGHYVRAFVLCGRDQMEEAGKAVGEALRLDPQDADYFALQSYVRASQGRWQESLELAEAGLRLNAGHVDCLNRRALSLPHLGRGAEGIAVIKTALARDPENPRTFANCGWVHLQAGDPAAALGYFRDAMALNPRLKSVRQGVTDALVQLVQRGKRFPDLGPFGQALRHDPELQAGRQKVVEALLQRWRPRGRTFGGALVLAWFLGLPQPGFSGAFGRDHTALLPLLTLNWLAGGLFCMFYFISRLADPLYCLLIRGDPVAGSLLSRDQHRASWAALFCLIPGAAALAVGLALARPLPLFAGLFLLFLLAPLAQTYQCAAGWPRRLMAGYTALLGGVAGATVVLTLTDPPSATLPGLLFLIGVALTGRVGQAFSRAWQGPSS